MGKSLATPARRAEWLSDPDDVELIRYWDGQRWTEYTLLKPSGWDAAGAGRRRARWQRRWIAAPALVMALLVAVALVNGQQDTSSSNNEAGSSDLPTPVSEPTAPVETEAPPAVMPSVIGLNRKQSEQALAAAGLAVSDIRKVPSDQPKGTVLRQGRKAGVSLIAGSSVALVIAVPYPRIPDVVGRTEAKARTLLRNAGFMVKTSVETRTSGADGAVLRQSPAGTNRAKPGSRVTVVIASVVRPVAPPAPKTNCTPGYDPCLPPASDYDCAGGSGDGPGYATGPVRISGSDPYDLDRDGDGIACES